MMIWIRRALVLVVLVAVTGCTMPVSSPPPRGTQAPRTRCLADPNETGMRPLFFLFCIESP
jgi:hypothetical protein